MIAALSTCIAAPHSQLPSTMLQQGGQQRELFKSLVTALADSSKAPVDGCSSPSDASSPHTAKSLQSKLLKQINSLSTKEELLGYIEQCHHLLDTINLATVLYRLARVYSFIQANEQKAIWKAELLESQSFTLLLNVTLTHLAQARAILCAQREVRGLNARCMSNLLWSIVKLEVTLEPGHVASGMALEVVMTAAPLVMHFLPDCTGQGLGNLLWSYAKVPAPPPTVVTSILARMVELLEGPASNNVLDAQALSNSLWSIAYIRSQPNELDDQQNWQDVVTSFLLLSAHHCINMLTGAVGQNVGQTDGQFSYQAMVNIAWSFSAILGSACGIQDPVRTLFLIIRQHAVSRLQSALTGTPPGRMTTHALTGGFNEQALSHIVHAFEEAQLLSPELLQAVFDVASLRLSRASTGPQGPLGFKPEELCVLLRASNLGIASPRAFLHSLSRLISLYPNCTSSWTATEALDLQRALTTPNPTASNLTVTQPLMNAAPAMSQFNPMQSQNGSHSYTIGAQMLSTGGSSGSNSPRSSIPRLVSQPQSALNSMLQELEVASIKDNHYNYAPGMPRTMEAPASQGASLQQAWVVDSSGNLRSVTLLMQPSQAAGQPTYVRVNNYRQ